MTLLSKCIGRAFKCLFPNGIATAISVERAGVGAYDGHGRAYQTASETFEIDAAVQPASPRDLEDLEEGRRSKETIKLFTQTELFGVSVDSRREPDRITYNDEVYEVHSVTVWGDVGGYWKAIAQKVGQ